LKYLLLDANNLLFRARYAAARRSYDNAIIHVFFRSLKPIIEKFSPDIAFFVLDGKPVRRLDLLPEYKGTRKYHDDDNFQAQRKECISLVTDCLPLTVCRHPQAEADDVIAHLVLNKLPSEAKKIIVSSDTDFIQLCQDAENTSLYNPIRKSYTAIPDYPYAVWKSLRGDGSDNIDGFRGIGDKRAAALSEDDANLELFLGDHDKREKFIRNMDLIQLRGFENDDNIIHSYKEDMESLLQRFNTLKFSSMINEKSWNTFSSTFKGISDGTSSFK
jgi:5'-3' exonuclease